ncbi:MAG: hypothetical protein JRJ34_03890 [Deltaproteobacteria bacterium]|nr:hypothetical protein [Deltaproteobacteria bacterium]
MELNEAYDTTADCRRKMQVLKAMATSIADSIDQSKMEFDFVEIFYGFEAIFKEFHGQLMEVEGTIYESLQKEATESPETAT